MVFRCGFDHAHQFCVLDSYTAWCRPRKGFMIEDQECNMEDFISDSPNTCLSNLICILKVKLLFVTLPFSRSGCYKHKSAVRMAFNVAAENIDADPDEPEHYSGHMKLQKAHRTQTLDTSGKSA